MKSDVDKNPNNQHNEGQFSPGPISGLLQLPEWDQKGSVLMEKTMTTLRKLTCLSSSVSNVIINPGLNRGNDNKIKRADFTALGVPTDGTFAQFIYLGKGW